MTLEEKAGQLNQVSGGVFTGPAQNDPGQKAKMEDVRKGRMGSFLNVSGVTETKAIQKIAVEESRLGIPLLFAMDVIHGYKTVFPVPLGEACSWDLDLMEKSCSTAAREAAAAGLHWTFAPMVDISDDARWGRVVEGAGEDPYLGSLVAGARVRGFQGKAYDDAHILSTVKHFAAYGAVQSGREYNYVDMSRQRLWNAYLPPYQAAVEAGAASVMNSFNVFEGIPASAQPYLVGDVLRKKWGFKGILVSDWASFDEMIAWGYVSNLKDAVEKATNAGSMIDMESRATVNFLPELVREGKVDIKLVDEAVSRLLRIKFEMGLFEKPYAYSDEQREKTRIFTPENRKQALETAKRSIVLLKNQNNLLPIAAGSKKIALFGAHAASGESALDFWSGAGDARQLVTLEAGMRKDFPNMTYAKGFQDNGKSDPALIKEALALAQQAEVLVVQLGISGALAGEDRSVANPIIAENQLELVRALKTTGKPVVALITGGRPLVLTQLEPMVDAMLQCWLLGTETGSGIAEVFTGRYNPSAKTVMSFPYAVGQIPVSYRMFNTGRPLPPSGDSTWKSRYRDIPNHPFYPFGYGLSYTRFEYSGVKLSAPTVKKGGEVTVEVTVKNAGQRDGEEIVQLYIRDHVASIVRPLKELKGYQKIALKAGESRTLSFKVGSKELSFLNAEGDPVLEAGKFSVFVGPDSKNCTELALELQ
jgi:beta-glucosidase